MKFIGIICITAIAIYFCYIWFSQPNSNEFENIKAGENIESVIAKLGMPKSISENYKIPQAQDWSYYIWPIPKTYTVVILNNKVIDKHKSISP